VSKKFTLSTHACHRHKKQHHHQPPEQPSSPVVLLVLLVVLTVVVLVPSASRRVHRVPRKHDQFTPPPPPFFLLPLFSKQQTTTTPSQGAHPTPGKPVGQRFDCVASHTPRCQVQRPVSGQCVVCAHTVAHLTYQLLLLPTPLALPDALRGPRVVW